MGGTTTVYVTHTVVLYAKDRTPSSPSVPWRTAVVTLHDALVLWHATAEWWCGGSLHTVCHRDPCFFGCFWMWAAMSQRKTTNGVAPHRRRAVCYRHMYLHSMVYGDGHIFISSWHSTAARYSHMCCVSRCDCSIGTTTLRHRQRRGKGIYTTHSSTAACSTKEGEETPHRKGHTHTHTPETADGVLCWCGGAVHTTATQGAQRSTKGSATAPHTHAAFLCVCVCLYVSLLPHHPVITARMAYVYISYPPSLAGCVQSQNETRFFQ